MRCLSLIRGAALAVALAAGGCASHAGGERRTNAHAVAQATPSALYGELFEAVELRRIFSDSKQFADMVARRAPSEILLDYRRAAPMDDAALRVFVDANFAPPDQAGGRAPVPGRPVLEHIRDLWDVLSRPPVTAAPYSSALAMPAPYVVPGGRFREIYYWDSYFTMLGLAQDGRDDLIEGMLSNFESLIDRYGFIPNGSRSYYLGRSQPPFFALMIGLSGQHDPVTRRRRLRALKAEYAFWMAGEACAPVGGACERVVRLRDGSLLNRNWDDHEGPRDESYFEDVETARASTRPSAVVYRHLRATGESGWDFSSRWLEDGRTLSTIRTVDVAPVDLNSLIYAMETVIASECDAIGDSACTREFNGRAAARQRAISRRLWLASEGRFADLVWGSEQPTATLSAATLYPLFVGLADQAQAHAVASTVRHDLLAPGGLRTTTQNTGQQWDAPNGWAPLQWIAIAGLRRYGEADLAHDIASRWSATVVRTYAETGKLMEKYDIEERRAGGGGEYPTQDGFGWTNGVMRVIASTYPDINLDVAAQRN